MSGMNLGIHRPFRILPASGIAICLCADVRRRRYHGPCFYQLYCYALGIPFYINISNLINILLLVKTLYLASIFSLFEFSNVIVAFSVLLYLGAKTVPQQKVFWLSFSKPNNIIISPVSFGFWLSYSFPASISFPHKKRKWILFLPGTYIARNNSKDSFLSRKFFKQIGDFNWIICTNNIYSFLETLLIHGF
jgi:hypothetical protein